MYRRHLKMVLVKDVEANRSTSEFVQRVAAIPVVYLAWNIATEAYRNVKYSNKFFKVSLATTEKAACFVSKPVFRKFEKQLKAADQLACKGLDTLQGIVPSIIHQQEKLYRQTKDIYEETVESGLKKYEMVKKLGASKAAQLINESSQKFSEFLASPYGEVCEIAMDFVFDAGELYVDYYLPPLGDERPEKLFGDRGKEPVWKRAELLRNRFKERLYKHSLLEIQRFRLKTKTFIASIYHFNMYEYLVEIYPRIPSAVFNTVIHIFSSLEEVLIYLASLVASQRKKKNKCIV
ncbi:lipid storage droplets surface-binding protein 2-like [Stegodyphus dumicola]|uniref:lipid storage droplets surface-binding protein 2-like n=1 Tax=Stegodyphus dumicola TaxID=202533 RepID=UPI0015B0132B|nr:lipid storage droplets surface-binding protein 2-like [Stegodyphus dumicola]XP_035219709.1 lipid storage droplets surface-binding protein 2-like [Stegodyphus dumicola]XP_035219710.1 lipid storage droplets surface-binding protein 2-like [Stegodyphus dumicola]XP_035219711.1 lipid storage droplets surface-binding protein 2-like [Stegodyphus dumicola]